MVAEVNRLIRKFLHCLLSAAVLFFCSAEKARSSGLTLISDAETQNYLAAVARPLFQAAGLTFNGNNVFIVSDTSLNAFVSDGNYLFVHTGTLLEADSTNELSGILAHETGHILGGHIVRQKLKMQDMQYVMLASMLAAGATAVSTGHGDAAMAVILGTQSSALNSMINHQLEEERSADESAVRLLSKTKQSTAGLMRFMKKIKKQNALSGIEENSYFRTHPVTGERINHFLEAAKSNTYPKKSPLDSQFALVQAKLSAFLEEPKKVRRRYPASRTDVAARYAHSVLDFREGKIRQAVETISTLEREYPSSPYFSELKGQFLFESGAVGESIPAYREALRKLPDNPLLQTSLAHALLENSPNKAKLREAVTLLQKALLKTPNAGSWQLLSRAYGMDGKKAASYYAAAEFNYTIGNIPAARSQIRQALDLKPEKALRLKLSDLQERLKEDD